MWIFLRVGRLAPGRYMRCTVMDNIRLASVAFTGHRTYCDEGERQLADVLEMLYSEGYRRFLTGMAWGFDLAAGLAVIGLRRRHGDVRLVAVEPFGRFRALFSGVEATVYDEVLASCDERVTVCGTYTAACYRLRNDFLVDHAAVVVAWYDGGSDGGTAYTVRRARRHGIPVINLRPSEQLSFGWL